MSHGIQDSRRGVVALRNEIPDTPQGRIFSTFSRDSARTFRVSGPPLETVTEELWAIFQEHRVTSAVVSTGEPSDPKTQPIEIEYVSFPLHALGKFPGVDEITRRAAEYCLSQTGIAALAESLHIEGPAAPSWRVTIKLFPSAAALRNAGIRNYALSMNNEPLDRAFLVRGLVAIPIASPAANLYFYHALSGAKSEQLCQRAIISRNGTDGTETAEYFAAPQSMCRSNVFYASTNDRGTDSTNSRYAVIGLTLVQGGTSATALRFGLLGLRPCNGATPGAKVSDRPRHRKVIARPAGAEPQNTPTWGLDPALPALPTKTPADPPAPPAEQNPAASLTAASPNKTRHCDFDAEFRV